SSTEAEEEAAADLELRLRQFELHQLGKCAELRRQLRECMEPADDREACDGEAGEEEKTFTCPDDVSALTVGGFGEEFEAGVLSEVAADVGAAGGQAEGRQ